MKAYIKSILAMLLLILMCNCISIAQTVHTPSEIYVQTEFFDVILWKNNLVNGRIDVYDNSTEINLFPFFYFGSNSSDKAKVGLFNRNNHYSMFMGKPQDVNVQENEDRTVITAVYPKAYIRYDGSRKLSGTMPEPLVFSGQTTVTVYHDTYRVDVKSVQKIREPLYTHIAWFSQINISDADHVDFGVKNGFFAELQPWSSLNFMYLDPEGKVFFKQASYDEKPPFKMLGEKEEFYDYLIAGNENDRYMIYAPKWKEYASLGYNRKNIPDNSILFHKSGKDSARIIFITKDTTLGQGRDVLHLNAGVYENRISIVKLEQTDDTQEIYQELMGQQ